MTPDTITRADLDAAYMELAAASGAPSDLIRDAALELAVGADASNVGFPSLSAEIDAVAFIASTFGVGSGATMPGTGLELSDVDDWTDSYATDPTGTWAAQEVARLAETATTKITGRDGRVHDRYMIDPVAAARGLAPRSPDRPGLPANDALMSDAQASEVDGILALTQTGLRKSDYPAVPSRREARNGTDVALSQRKIDSYLELAEDGGTRTYTSNEGSVTVTKVSSFEDDSETITGDDEIAAEVDRYHAMGNALFGIAPMSTTGNYSCSPPDPSTFGQFRKGPWHSEYGGAA